MSWDSSLSVHTSDLNEKHPPPRTRHKYQNRVDDTHPDPHPQPHFPLSGRSSFCSRETVGGQRPVSFELPALQVPTLLRLTSAFPPRVGARDAQGRSPGGPGPGLWDGRRLSCQALECHAVPRRPLCPSAHVCAQTRLGGDTLRAPVPDREPGARAACPPQGGPTGDLQIQWQRSSQGGRGHTHSQDHRVKERKGALGISK